MAFAAAESVTSTTKKHYGKSIDRERNRHKNLNTAAKNLPDMAWHETAIFMQHKNSQQNTVHKVIIIHKT